MEERKDRILVVDDDANIRFFLIEALKKMGYEAEAVQDAESGFSLLDKNPFNLVILDMKLPGISGLEAIQVIKGKDPRIPIIIITAFGSKELALRAVQEGAYDYFTKPLSLQELAVVIKRALEKNRLQKEVEELRSRVFRQYDFGNMIGRSGLLHEALAIVKKIANTDLPVLICGESGTGKELIADAIHINSARRDRPLIKLNCAAIPEGLLESELFGHEKGSFTGALTKRLGAFEAAHGGTILLDEIGDMSPSMQAKILRVLEQKEFQRLGSNVTVKVDVRTIAATNKDLVKELQEKRFREDLYFRLNGVSIFVPPLRDRKDDIPLLVYHFLNQCNEKTQKMVKDIEKESLDALMKYEWPGNVRELENCIERAHALCEGEVLCVECLPLYMRRPIEVPHVHCGPKLQDPLPDVLDKIERNMLIEALIATKGVQVEAAKLLGINKRGFLHRVKKLGINVKKLIEDGKLKPS
ncbi:MAG TPA: sigma-54-dependent transcriptional regulator [Candidatus Hypogeohydataceae bacterium YC38]